MATVRHISKRATESLNIVSPLNAAMFEVMGKLQHPQFNPEGAMNLGLAHNDLLQEKVFERTRACLEIVPDDINYGAPEGSRQFLILMQAFFDRHFHPRYPLKYDHILAQTGAGASVNQIIMAVSDPGDYCLIPSPYYGAFDLDVSVNTGVPILPVFLHDDDLKDMSVDLDRLEKTYQEAVNEGKRVTSMVITNPENPLGRTYSRKDIITFMAFASNHDIHLIFDEIYALSTCSHIGKQELDDPFVSILSLPYKDYIEPSLIHVIYGLSKDFALNGLRMGFIIDQFNEPLRKALIRCSPFSYMNTITDRLFCNFFSDEKWIDDYLEENRCALAASYSKTTEFLKLHNVNYLEAEAGPFMLLDLKSYFDEPTFEFEKTVWHRMVNNGVYLAPGFAFHSHRPGFFRLTFALPWDVLQIGLNRMIQVLK
ncbi:unnamed protein product [Mucor hiemalis]